MSTYKNNIPNLGRHDKVVRDADFIKITEKNKILTEFNNLLKYFSTDENSEVSIKLKEITYNYLDAVTINPDGSIVLNTTTDPDTGEIVPDIGDNSIESFLQKIEDLYQEYLAVIDENNDWKIRLDNYFNTVFSEFVLRVKSLFGVNTYNIFTFMKYNKDEDYMFKDRVNLTNTPTTHDYMRLNPDVTSYNYSFNFNYDTTLKEMIILDFEPIIISNTIKNFTIQLTIKNKDMFYPITIICDNNVFSYIVEDFVFNIRDTLSLNTYEYSYTVTDENGVSTDKSKIIMTMSNNSVILENVEVDYTVLIGSEIETTNISKPFDEIRDTLTGTLATLDFHTISPNGTMGVYPNNINMDTGEQFIEEPNKVLEVENYRYKPLNIVHLNLESKEVGEYWPQRYINFNKEENIYEYDKNIKFKRLNNDITEHKIGNYKNLLSQKRIYENGYYRGMTRFSEKVPLGSISVQPISSEFKTILSSIDTSIYGDDALLNIKDYKENSENIIFTLFPHESIVDKPLNIIYNKTDGNVSFLHNIEDQLLDSEYLEYVDNNTLFSNTHDIYSDREILNKITKDIDGNTIIEPIVDAYNEDFLYNRMRISGTTLQYNTSGTSWATFTTYNDISIFYIYNNRLFNSNCSLNTNELVIMKNDRLLYFANGYLLTDNKLRLEAGILEFLDIDDVWKTYNTTGTVPYKGSIYKNGIKYVEHDFYLESHDTRNVYYKGDLITDNNSLYIDTTTNTLMYKDVDNDIPVTYYSDSSIRNSTNASYNLTIRNKFIFNDYLIEPETGIINNEEFTRYFDILFHFGKRVYDKDLKYDVDSGALMCYNNMTKGYTILTSIDYYIFNNMLFKNGIKDTLAYELFANYSYNHTSLLYVPMKTYVFKVGNLINPKQLRVNGNNLQYTENDLTWTNVNYPNYKNFYSSGWYCFDDLSFYNGGVQSSGSRYTPNRIVNDKYNLDFQYNYGINVNVTTNQKFKFDNVLITEGNNVISTLNKTTLTPLPKLIDRNVPSRLYKNADIIFETNLNSNINAYKTSKNEIVVLIENSRYDLKDPAKNGVRIIKNIDAEETPVLSSVDIEYGSWKYFLESDGTYFFGSKGSEGVRIYKDATIKTSLKYGSFNFVKTIAGIFAFNTLNVEYSGKLGRNNYYNNFKINNDVENGLGIYLFNESALDFVNVHENGVFSNIVETNNGIYAYNELSPILYKFDYNTNKFYKLYEFSFGNTIFNIKTSDTYEDVVIIKNSSDDDFYRTKLDNNFGLNMISISDLETKIIGKDIIEYTDENPDNIIVNISPSYKESNLFRNELVPESISIGEMLETSEYDVVFNNEKISNSKTTQFFYKDDKTDRYILSKSGEVTEFNNISIINSLYEFKNKLFNLGVETNNIDLSDPKNYIKLLNGAIDVDYDTLQITKMFNLSNGIFGIKNIEYDTVGVPTGKKVFYLDNNSSSFVCINDINEDYYPTSIIEVNKKLYMGDEINNIHSIDYYNKTISLIDDGTGVTGGYYLFNTETLGPIILSRFDNTHMKYFDNDNNIVTIEKTDENRYSLGDYRQWLYDSAIDLSSSIYDINNDITKILTNNIYFDYGINGVYGFIIKEDISQDIKDLNPLNGISKFSLVKFDKDDNGQIISEKCVIKHIDDTVFTNDFYLGPGNIPDEYLDNYSNNITTFGFHLYDFGLIFNLNGWTFRLNNTSGEWEKINIDFRNNLSPYTVNVNSTGVGDPILKTLQTNNNSPVFISSDKNDFFKLNEVENEKMEDYKFDLLFAPELIDYKISKGYNNDIINIQNILPKTKIVTMFPSVYRLNEELNDTTNRLLIENHLTDEFKLYLILKNDLDIGVRTLRSLSDVSVANPTGAISNYKISDTVYNIIYSCEYKISKDNYLYMKIDSMDYTLGTGYVYGEDTIVPKTNYYKISLDDLFIVPSITDPDGNVVVGRNDVDKINVTEYNNIIVTKTDIWYNDMSLFDDMTGFRPLFKINGGVKNNVDSILCYNPSTNTLNYVSKLYWKIRDELYCYDNQSELSICKSENEIYGLGWANYNTAQYRGIVRYEDEEFKLCPGTDLYSKMNYDNWDYTFRRGYDTTMLQTREYGFMVSALKSPLGSTSTSQSGSNGSYYYNTYNFPFLVRDKYNKNIFNKFGRMYSKFPTTDMNLQTNKGLFNFNSKIGIFKKGNIVQFDDLTIVATDTDLNFGNSSRLGDISETSAGMFIGYGNGYTNSGMLKYNKYLGEFEKDKYFDMTNAATNLTYINRFEETNDGIFIAHVGRNYNYYDGYYYNKNKLLTGSRISANEITSVIETSVGTLYSGMQSASNQVTYRYNHDIRSGEVVYSSGSYPMMMTDTKLGLIGVRGDGSPRTVIWDGTKFILYAISNATSYSLYKIFNSKSRNDIFFMEYTRNSTSQTNTYKFNSVGTTNTLIPVTSTNYPFSMTETEDLKEFESYSFTEIINEFELMEIPYNKTVKVFGHMVYNGTIININSVRVNRNVDGSKGVTFTLDKNTRIPVGGKAYTNLIDFNDNNFTLGTISRGNINGYNNRDDFKTNISKLELSILYDKLTSDVEPPVIKQYYLGEDGKLYYGDSLASGYVTFDYLLYLNGERSSPNGYVDTIDIYTDTIKYTHYNGEMVYTTRNGMIHVGKDWDTQQALRVINGQVNFGNRVVNGRISPSEPAGIFDLFYGRSDIIQTSISNFTICGILHRFNGSDIKFYVNWTGTSTRNHRAISSYEIGEYDPTKIQTAGGLAWHFYDFRDESSVNLEGIQTGQAFNNALDYKKYLEVDYINRRMRILFCKEPFYSDGEDDLWTFYPYYKQSSNWVAFKDFGIGI